MEGMTEWDTVWICECSVSTDWMGAKFTADAVLSASEELIQRAWISTFPPQSVSPCTSSLPRNSNRCVTRLHTRLQFILKTSVVPGSIHLYTVQHICLHSYLYKSRKIMHIFNILASRARKLTSRLFHVAYCMSNYKYIPEHTTMSSEPCFFYLWRTNNKHKTKVLNKYKLFLKHLYSLYCSSTSVFSRNNQMAFHTG